MTPTWQITFGARLRARRLEQGLGLRELAKASNMYWIELDRYERGEQTPDLNKLYTLARELDTDLHALLPAHSTIKTT